MHSEGKMTYGKNVNILKCRNISAIISIFLLVLQLPVSSSSYISTDDCLTMLKSTTGLILEEKHVLCIWPHRNTTTLFLTSPLCDFSLKLNFAKEDLLSDDSDYIEDVDGKRCGTLYFFLDHEAINITLIKDPTLTYYIEDPSCIAKHNIRVKFDASSPADAALVTTCSDSENTNGYGSRDGSTENATNPNYTPTYTTSTTKIPMILITLIVFGLIGLLAFSCHLCTLRWRNTRSNSAAPKSNWSAPATLPYNRFYNDDGLVPNSSDRVPPSPSGPVPNFNTPAPYPSDPDHSVPPYSTNPSSTDGLSSPSAYGSNITYIYDNNRL